MIKNPPAKAGDARVMESVPGLGKCPEEDMATYSGIFASKIPWTEDPESWSQWDRKV